VNALGLLQAARAHIALKGHSRRGPWDGDKPCSIMALRRARDTFYADDEAYMAALTALTRAVGPIGIIVFTENSETLEVLGAFDRTIAALEARL
jgi:hypothetical protein